MNYFVMFLRIKLAGIKAEILGLKDMRAELDSIGIDTNWIDDLLKLYESMEASISNQIAVSDLRILKEAKGPKGPGG